MNKEYIKPEIEKISFQPEDELMGVLDDNTGVEGASGWMPLKLEY